MCLIIKYLHKTKPTFTSAQNMYIKNNIENYTCTITTACKYIKYKINIYICNNYYKSEIGGLPENSHIKTNIYKSIYYNSRTKPNEAICAEPTGFIRTFAA